MNTKTSKQKLYILCECAILIAVAAVLAMIRLWRSPLGGSVTLLSMLPVMIISIRHGIKWGLGSGFVFSVIQLIQGLDTVGSIPTATGVVMAIIFDYIMPFTCLGLAGVFMKKQFVSKKSEYLAILGGIVLALVLRFLCHFGVGSLLWYEITKLADWGDPWNTYVEKYGMWSYSFIYQIMYLGPDSLLVLLASPIVPKLRKMTLTK